MHVLKLLVKGPRGIMDREAVLLLANLLTGTPCVLPFSPQFRFAIILRALLGFKLQIPLPL